jgi:hypothetical protein
MDNASKLNVPPLSGTRTIAGDCADLELKGKAVLVKSETVVMPLNR